MEIRSHKETTDVITVVDISPNNLETPHDFFLNKQVVRFVRRVNITKIVNNTLPEDHNSFEETCLKWEFMFGTPNMVPLLQVELEAIYQSKVSKS